MKLTKEARGYTLKLTSKEMHDLLTIASIPGDILGTALKTSTRKWINKDGLLQTHGVYRLMKELTEQGVKFHV